MLWSMSLRGSKQCSTYSLKPVALVNILRPALISMHLELCIQTPLSKALNHMFNFKHTIVLLTIIKLSLCLSPSLNRTHTSLCNKMKKEITHRALFPSFITEAILKACSRHESTAAVWKGKNKWVQEI